QDLIRPRPCPSTTTSTHPATEATHERFLHSVLALVYLRHQPGRYPGLWLAGLALFAAPPGRPEPRRQRSRLGRRPERIRPPAAALVCVVLLPYRGVRPGLSGVVSGLGRVPGHAGLDAGQTARRATRGA